MAIKTLRSVLFLGLLFVLCGVGVARSEMAPAGGYLSDAGSTRLPMPHLQYRTRLAWLIASYHDNADTGSPLADILAGSTMQPLAKQALEREKAYILELPDDRAAAYYLALIDDYNKLELAVFDEGTISRPLKAGLIDLTANTIVALASNRVLNELVEKYAKALELEQAARREAGEELARRIAEDTISSAEFRINSFNAFLKSSREAAEQGLPVGSRVLDASEMTSLDEYFRWVSQYTGREVERKAIADALVTVPATMTSAQRNVYGTRILKTVVGTVPGPVAGAVIGPLGGDLGAAQIRSQAVMCYLESRCGCSSPRGNKLAAPSAWTAFLPDVTQHYQTRLGRLIASSSKWGFTLMMGNTRFRQEIDRLQQMRVNNPVEYTSWLVHFIQDIDALQAEFVAEARQTVGFFENLAGSFLAGELAAALVPAGGTPATVAGVLLSAGISSALEYANFSAERKVIASLQALRTKSINALAASDTDCGCNEAVGVGAAGTRQGVKNVAETQR